MRSWLMSVGLMFGIIESVEAQKIWVLPVRGAETQAAQIVQKFPNTATLEALAKEYETGTTYVEFSRMVTNEAVFIVLPAKMTAHQLMEALLKVRIARTEGARLIGVLSPVALSTLPLTDSEGIPIHLNLDSLFAVAGANYVSEAGGQNRSIAREPLHQNDGEANRVLISGHTHPELQAELSAALKLENVPEPPRDPKTDQMDWTAEGYPHSSFRQTRILYVGPSPFPVNDSFLRNLSRVRDYSLMGAQVDWLLSYLPYGRQDKTDQKRTAVGARLIADLIESVGTHSAIFVRAHAPQSEGFFSIPVLHVTGRETLNAKMRELGVQAILASDAGVMKIASLHATDLNIPMATISKQRDLTTGDVSISGVSGANLKDLVVGMIDDEVASGSTADRGAAYVESHFQPTRIHFFSTHLTGDGFAAQRSSHLDHIVVTDTLPVPASYRTRIDVAGITAELTEPLRAWISRPGFSKSNCMRLMHVWGSEIILAGENL